MTDETRAELRRRHVRVAIESIIRQESIGWPWEVRTRAPDHVMVEEVWTTPEPPPLTTAQQLALSVLLGDESVLPQALADYLLDQGHEYATAIRQQATDEGVKTGIEKEKDRCLHLLGLARSYFARGGAVSDMAADELRLAIEGNLKPTPKAFFRSSCLR